MSEYIWVSGVLPDRRIMSLFDMFVLVARQHLSRKTCMNESTTKKIVMQNPDLESECEGHKTANSNAFLEKDGHKREYQIKSAFCVLGYSIYIS